MSALDTTPDVVTVTPPGAIEPVYLRSPTFREWHELVNAHGDLIKPDGTAGRASAALIAKTLTTCVCDVNGKTCGLAADKVLSANHAVVMWIYDQCWRTVLKSGEQVVQKHEKNSAAGQD